MAASVLPDIPPFDPDEDLSTTPQRWEAYLERIDIVLVACNITEDKRKWAVQHLAGEKVQVIIKHLTYDKTDGNHYKNLHKALTAHFEPKKNIAHATFKFLQNEQGEEEGIDAFVTRLKSQAARCEFNDLDRHLKDHIIF